MSASNPHSTPDLVRLNEFITSTPASQHHANFLDSFSPGDLSTAFERACQHFESVVQERSRLIGEIQRVRGEFDPFRDDESMAFFALTIGADEFVDVFCGPTSKEAVDGLELESLKEWIMYYCRTVEKLVGDIKTLEGMVEDDRATQGGRIKG